jgi:hypothetical protein
MANAAGRRRPAGGARARRQPAARSRPGQAAGACLLALVAGCAASQSSKAASPTPPHQSTRKAMAARYLAIALPANHRLDVEVDGYGDHERDDLEAARQDLRAEVATERRFDAQLLQIRFPAPITTTARSMVSANQARIALTERQARSASLVSLRSFDHRHKAADAAVETQVRQIRVSLSLPPPATS